MYPAKPSAPAPSQPAPPPQTGAAPAPQATPPPVPATGIPVGVGGLPAFDTSTHQWSTGLCDCFDDFGLCCLTLWCPCVTFGRVAEIVDRGATSCGTGGALYVLLAFFTGCPWIYSCTHRTKMRAQFGLPALPCGDCCVHCCCDLCALCQEHRELKARGYEPALGWDLNAQKAARAAMYPPAAQGMGR